MSHIKRNYKEEKIVADRGVTISPETVKEIAAVGSIVVIRGGSLYRETHS